MTVEFLLTYTLYENDRNSARKPS